MHDHAVPRALTLVALGFVALTAFGGGAALVLGSVDPGLATILSPPEAYLDGSPFDSYLIPGLALGVVLGGVHAVAFTLVLLRSRWAVVTTAVAAYAARASDVSRAGGRRPSRARSSRPPRSRPGNGSASAAAGS